MSQKAGKLTLRSIDLDPVLWDNLLRLRNWYLKKQLFLGDGDKLERRLVEKLPNLLEMRVKLKVDRSHALQSHQLRCHRSEGETHIFAIENARDLLVVPKHVFLPFVASSGLMNLSQVLLHPPFNLWKGIDDVVELRRFEATFSRRVDWRKLGGYALKGCKNADELERRALCGTLSFGRDST